MSESLINLVGEFKTLLDLSASADPEDEQIFADTLEAIKGEIESKTDGIAIVRMNMVARSEMVAKEINRLRAVEDAINNHIKRLDNYTKMCMEDLGVKEIKSDLHKIKIVGNGGLQPLIIPDEGKVPESYLKVTYSPDKDKIRAALKEGKELEFAFLGERGTRLKID